MESPSAPARRYFHDFAGVAKRRAYHRALMHKPQPVLPETEHPSADTFSVYCLCAEWCGTCREYRPGFQALASISLQPPARLTITGRATVPWA